MRRQVTLCKRLLWRTVDVTQRMVPAAGRAATLFRDVQENAESYHFYADELLDDANTLLSVQLALASHRTSEVMRVLTVFSVFFLPLTFIVGVYGMNFDFMPELRERWGYPAVLGFMAMVTLAHLPLVPPARMAQAMSYWALLIGVLVGAGAAWLLVRRTRRPGLAPGVSPHLLPDPALEWLRRAHGATGVWVAEMDSRDGEPHAERVVDAERLSVTQIVAVDRRLERARDQEQSGAERMEGGTLVFHAAAGIAVGLLLPGGADAVRLEKAESDLRRLADGVRRRPQIVQLAQANTQEASLESVGSVGLRLAYQLERMLDAQVVVAARESGHRPRRRRDRRRGTVRVIGVSGRGDRRLLDSMLPPDSDLARVSRGEVDSIFFEGDPLGGVVPDRRHRPGAVLVLPMRAGERCVGGVALWPPGGREPSGGVRAEILAALANAGPGW